MARPRRSKTRLGGQHAPHGRKALVDEPSARLEAGHRLWNEGRRHDALDLYREAIRREPCNVRTYLTCAHAYAKQFEFQRMDEVLQKLLQLGPRHPGVHPGVHHGVGEIYAVLKMPARAIACYEQAAQSPDVLPVTWIDLAALYEGAHRLDEAEQLLERAQRAGAQAPLATIVRARVQRRRGCLADAAATLQGLIDRAPATEWACQAAGELALLRDREGDFAGAIAAIEKCKQWQLAREGKYWEASEAVHRRSQQMIDDMSPERLARWRDEGAAFPPRRVALLTGFPRSGTTLLEQVLDAHPDLISSEERDFVGRELMHTLTQGTGDKRLAQIFDETSPQRLASERLRYFRAMEYLLGEPVGDRMHLDKNPAYNLTLPLFLRLFPETRLVVALRDPRDVVLSCYLRYLPLNTVSVRFLTPQRTAERYALDMRSWLKMREIVAAPWCEIRYEDAVADLPAQARRALATLGLPWDDCVLDYRARLGAVKQVTSPTYEAVAEPIYTRAVRRWENYLPVLEPAFAELEPFLREFGYA